MSLWTKPRPTTTLGASAAAAAAVAVLPVAEDSTRSSRRLSEAKAQLAIAEAKLSEAQTKLAENEAENEALMGRILAVEQKLSVTAQQSEAAFAKLSGVEQSQRALRQAQVNQTVEEAAVGARAPAKVACCGWSETIPLLITLWPKIILSLIPTFRHSFLSVR